MTSLQVLVLDSVVNVLVSLNVNLIIKEQLAILLRVVVFWVVFKKHYYLYIFRGSRIMLLLVWLDQVKVIYYASYIQTNSLLYTDESRDMSRVVVL